jgi:hypothetical protein
MKPKALVLAIGLLTACSWPIRAEEPLYVYERDVTVTNAGWVKLNVPMEMLSRLSSSVDEILVLDQDGRAIPAYLYERPPEKPGMVRTVALSNMEHFSGQYVIDVDLGPGIFRHRMISIDLPGKGLAEGVILEGSSDKSSWHILRKGSMFRLNYAGLTEKTSLEYAPTTDRYLRIYWPENAGFPLWQKVSVADWTEKEEDFLAEDLKFDNAWENDNERAYYLSLPPFPLEKASIELFPKISYPLSCRLTSFSGGEWKSASEVVLYPDIASTIFLPQSAFSGKSLLILNGGGYKINGITKMLIRYVPKFIVFKAEKAGIFKLYYGAIGGAPPPKSVEGLKPLKEEYIEALLGPESENKLPEIPPLNMLIGGSMPQADFALRREIIIPPEGSNLISLELPPEIYEYANSDLSDIRLDCGGRQMPYINYSPPENSIVFEKYGISPVPVKNENRSAIAIDLPAENMPLNFLELTIPSQPFSRRITLMYKGKGNSEEEGKVVWRELESGVWQCPAAYGILTRFAFKCVPVPSRELKVVFDDLDNAPLPFVNVVLWGSRDVLIFPRPAPQEKIFFCAGASGLSEPVYDFQKLSDIVLKRRTEKASLGEVEKQSAGKTMKILGRDLVVSKWLLLFAVLAVCMIIIFILAKSIKDVGLKK